MPIESAFSKVRNENDLKDKIVDGECGTLWISTGDHISILSSALASKVCEMAGIPQLVYINAARKTRDVKEGVVEFRQSESDKSWAITSLSCPIKQRHPALHPILEPALIFDVFQCTIDGACIEQQGQTRLLSIDVVSKRVDGVTMQTTLQFLENALINAPSFCFYDLVALLVFGTKQAVCSFLTRGNKDQRQAYKWLDEIQQNNGIVSLQTLKQMTKLVIREEKHPFFITEKTNKRVLAKKRDYRAKRAKLVESSEEDDDEQEEEDDDEMDEEEA